ncbi:MAG: hypothetical protein VKP62_00495, partial [Candidatus Sericytochromatia bacterium]|nr:hypothetical protein [Candidatus Sericytochromatia bacterium]
MSLAGLPLPFTLGPGGFQPSPSRGGGSRAQPTPPPPPGPQVFRLLVGLPGEARGLAAYDETTYVVAIDQRMRSFTSLLAGVDHTLGASGEDCYAVAADPANARVFVGRTNSLWQCPMPHGSGTPQQIITGLTSCGLAIGRQDLYVSNHDLATSQNSVARISLASTAIVADVQVGGAPYNPPGSHFCHGLAIDDATATPTLYLGTLEGEVYSVQDGGATHTILASGLGAVMGMVFSPANRTLYLTSIADDRVYALNVDTLATATVTLDQPFTTNHGPWG